MKLPGKGTLITNGVALVVALFLYLGDVFDYLRAQTADVAALVKLPNVTFAALVLVATGIAAALAVMAIVRNQPANAKAYRLLPIVVLVSVFVDLFVLSADAPIMSPPDQMTMALHAFGRVVHERGNTQSVASSDRDLFELLKEFGAPPYLVKGKPATGFTVQRRDNCEGPVTDAPGAQLGTFLYCIAKNKKAAWITVVALPYEERFGAPRVLTRGGVPLFAMVTPRIPDVAGETEEHEVVLDSLPPLMFDAGVDHQQPIDAGP